MLGVCQHLRACIGSDGAGNRLHPAVSVLGGKAARPRLHRRCLHGGRQNPGCCRNATDMGRPELGRSLFSQTSSNSQQPCFGRDQSCKPVAEKAYPRQIAHVLMNGEPEGPLQCRSEEQPSELQSLMRISYAVFCLKNTSSTDSNNNTH